MLRSYFYQQSLLHVDPAELRLPRSSFEAGLREVLPKLVSVDDFRDLHPSADGAPTCDPLVLTGMLLLQFRYNLGDKELITRCRCDLRFRYALALEKGKSPPGQASVKRFRAALRQKKGEDWLFQLTLRLAAQRGLVTDSDVQAADSTDTDCRGAVIDTFNLISTALRQVVRRVARVLDRDANDLAREWLATRYLARSIKGQAAIDWSDVRARNALLTREIADVKRIGDLVANLGIDLPVDITEAVKLMQQVAVQDVEKLPDGTYQIAQGTSKGRIVSTTDPEARHGRKSSSKTITGFKTHVAGTLETQFVTGITVTDASVHDSTPTPELIRQAESAGLKPKDLVGDMAYGTGANRRVGVSLGVAIHSKIPAPSHKGLTKREFAIDLENMSVTCPNGVTVKSSSPVVDPTGSGERVPQFRFPPATCRACPLRELCCTSTAKGEGRRIILNPYERELQDARKDNLKPQTVAMLRRRSAVERLLSHLVRMGMRQARFFGMHMVQFQAYMTAAAYNLQRYITLTTTVA